VPVWLVPAVPATPADAVIELFCTVTLAALIARKPYAPDPAPVAVPEEAVMAFMVAVPPLTRIAVVLVPPGPLIVRSRNSTPVTAVTDTPPVEVVVPEREAKFVPYPPRTVRLATPTVNPA
jgi:hypothetical protein